MKLLVGLGNPGPKYETTRHNAGFLVLDRLLEMEGGRWEGGVNRFGGETAKVTTLGSPCVYLKPMTYMNRSGQSVGEVMRFFKIPPAGVVVLHDDIDVPSGKVKARTGGGHGGHNGIRSIIDCTGLADFHRLKLGVGRPPGPMDPADWVLSPMTNPELETLLGGMLKEVLLRLKSIFEQSPA